MWTVVLTVEVKEPFSNSSGIAGIAGIAGQSLRKQHRKQQQKAVPTGTIATCLWVNYFSVVLQKKAKKVKSASCYCYSPTGICFNPTQKLWYPRSHSSQNNILSCQHKTLH